MGEIVGQYDPKKDFGAAARVMAALLQRVTTFSTHIDAQTNILLGVNSALFLFSATRIERGGSWFFVVLALFALASAVVCLLAIHPPKHLRKRKQRESALYSRSLAAYDDVEVYASSTVELLGDPERLQRELAVEIYNLWRYYYRPKRELFNKARTVLMTGLVVSAVVLVGEMVVG